LLPMNETNEAVVWGRRAVEELLLGTQPVRRVLLSDTARPSLRERVQQMCKDRGVECRIVPLPRLAQIANTPEHGGVLAQISAIPLLGIKEFLELPLSRREVVFAFEGVENPRNLGMAARSLVAAGIDHMIIPQTSSAQPDAVFLEASAGVGERVGVVRVPKLSEAVRELKAAGYWIFGLAGESSLSLWEHALPRPAVFVMGGETRGLRPAVRNAMDECISIPMKNGVDSLNVAVATSVVAFEVMRRE